MLDLYDFLYFVMRNRGINPEATATGVNALLHKIPLNPPFLKGGI